MNDILKGHDKVESNHSTTQITNPLLKDSKIIYVEMFELSLKINLTDVLKIKSSLERLLRPCHFISSLSSRAKKAIKIMSEYLKGQLRDLNSLQHSVRFILKLFTFGIFHFFLAILNSVGERRLLWRMKMSKLSKKELDVNSQKSLKKISQCCRSLKSSSSCHILYY